MEGASKRSGAAQAGNGGKMQMHANSSRERGQRYRHSINTFLQLFGSAVDATMSKMAPLFGSSSQLSSSSN